MYLYLNAQSHFYICSNGTQTNWLLYHETARILNYSNNKSSTYIKSAYTHTCDELQLAHLHSRNHHGRLDSSTGIIMSSSIRKQSSLPYCSMKLQFYYFPNMNPPQKNLTTSQAMVDHILPLSLIHSFLLQSIEHLTGVSCDTTAFFNHNMLPFNFPSMVWIHPTTTNYYWQAQHPKQNNDKRRNHNYILGNQGYQLVRQCLILHENLKPYRGLSTIISIHTTTGLHGNTKFWNCTVLYRFFCSNVNIWKMIKTTFIILLLKNHDETKLENSINFRNPKRERQSPLLWRQSGPVGPVQIYTERKWSWYIYCADCGRLCGFCGNFCGFCGNVCGFAEMYAGLRKCMRICWKVCGFATSVRLLRKLLRALLSMIFRYNPWCFDVRWVAATRRKLEMCDCGSKKKITSQGCLSARLCSAVARCCGRIGRTC